MFRIRQLYQFLKYALIVFAIVLTFVRLALYTVSQNPALLDQYLSESLGHTVTYDQFSARLHWFRPELEIKKLVISDTTGKQVLSFNRGLVRLKLLPLVTLGKIKPVILTIDQARFGLQKKPSGKIFMVGFDGDGNFFSTMIKSGYYALSNSQITFTDQGKTGQPIVLDQVNLVLESKHNQSKLAIESLLANQPSSFQLIADLASDKNHQSSSYTGEIFIKGSALPLAQFKHFLPWSIPVENSLLSFSLWGEIQHSILQSIRGDINAADIDWKTNSQSIKKLASLPKQAYSFIWLQQNKEGWDLAFDAIDLGQTLLPTGQQLSIQSVSRIDNPGELSYQLRLSELQLEKVKPLLKNLSGSTNLDKELVQLLGQIEMQGLLNHLQVNYYPNSTNNFWTACSDFSDLQLKFDNLANLKGNWSGQFCTNQHQTRFDLQTSKASIDIPTLFHSPINLSQLNGLINLQNTTEGWKLVTDSLTVSTPDLVMNLDLTLQANNHTPWFLNTNVNFDLTHAQNLKHYLPAKILATDVNQWVAGVFRSGSLNNGQFSYQGQLVPAPFKSKKATSSAHFRLNNTRIQFSPTEEWPQLSQFNADLNFKNGLATMNVDSGNSLGVNIKNGTIAIKDLAKLDNVQISTQLETTLELAENYIRNSPLEQKIGDIIHYLHPSGASGYHLDFMVPLHSETDQYWINGDVNFEDAKIQLTDIDLDIDQINGLLQFTEETVTADNIEAIVDSHPIKIDINDKPQHIGIESTMRLSDTFLQTRWPWLSSLHGTTMAKVNVEVGKQSDSKTTDVVVKLHSSLQGMRVDIPEPLYKPSDQQKDLAIKINLNSSNTVPIEVHYGKDTYADLRLVEKPGQHWELNAAHLLIGKGHLPSNDSIKFSLNAYLAEWDLLHLEKIQAFKSSFHPDSPHINHKVSQNSDFRFDIKINKLYFDKTSLGSFELVLDKNRSQWHGDIAGSIAKGTIEYTPGTQTKSENLLASRGKLDVLLESFNLVNTPKLNTTKDQAQDHYAKDFSPNILPSINIAVKQLVWGDFNMGEMSLETSATTNGLLIHSFSMDGSEHQLTAAGRWISNQSTTETALSGKLQSKNMAHFLHKFGIYEDIRKTAANINFDLNWQASPLKIDWKSLSGKMSLKLKHGRLLGIEPGIGRALGLFSLSAWERRLRLDFSDVVDDGFAYDNVNADFAMFNGNAYSSNLKIDGVAARVNLAGRIGLVAKDINAAVTVIPRSSIALPLAGAAGGPIGIGAGLVMQQVVGDEFETLSSSEYTITGQWTDPQVNLVPENGGIFTRMLWELQKMTGTNQSTGN